MSAYHNLKIFDLNGNFLHSSFRLMGGGSLFLLKTVQKKAASTYRTGYLFFTIHLALNLA